jgi:mRNA interferase RelE/StbE
MSKQVFEVVLHREAARELRALPKKLRQRVSLVIDDLAVNPYRPDAAKLQGRANAYRIRFGDYRLLYEVHATEVVVYVIGVAHRKEVYLRLLRRR